jgi:predicted permease
MSFFLDDLRHSTRQLSRRPLFTLTAVLTLAVGIGVNAVAFTVVNGVLFKRPAVASSGDVGRVLTTPGSDESGLASLAEYQRFQDATFGALDLAAEGRLSMAWRHEGTTRNAWVLFVSPRYFSLMDARPLAGRVAVTRAASGPPSVVIGERFWRRHLNAASLAGLTLRLNDTTVTVAGVLPESFRGPAGLYAPDVWLPLEDVAFFNTAPALQHRDYRWLFVFGRLQRGVTFAEVHGRIDAAANAMARDWPDSHRGRSARFTLLGDGNTELRAVSAAAAIAMAIIGLVLLLACFNVANLLLARAVERERDMAIRAAVGASPARLIRLVVTEGLLMAALAGVSALVIAGWTQVLVGSFAIPIEQPQHIDLAPDATVIAFVLGLVVVAGVLPGLWPALALARVDVLRALGAPAQAHTTAGGRPSPLRAWLVGAQIAGSTAFLIIAALFTQSYGRLSDAEMGFARDRLVVAEFLPASHGFDGDRTKQYVDALAARVGALPGVADVAVADRAPFFIGTDRQTAVSATGVACETDACPTYPTMAIGPGYFKTMGIAITRGREFDAGPTAGEVVINQPLARSLGLEGHAVGETLRLGDERTAVTVIGVTAKTHTRGLDREQPTLYVRLDRTGFEGHLTLVARTATAPEPVVRTIAEAAQDVDPRIPMLSVKTMHQRMAVQLWPFRTLSWLFAVCGTLALILAVVGLAGVVVYAVHRRRREFGVRVSVGATPRDLVADVLRSGARLLWPGLLAGALLAAAAARLAHTAFVGVDMLNPFVYFAVAVLEAAIVTAACIVPARRASRTDPLVILRSE